MGLTSSRGKRPARLHASMMGTRLSSINLRAVSRTRRSSSFSNESNSMKSTPRNLMAGIFCHSTELTDKEQETIQSSRAVRSEQRGRTFTTETGRHGEKPVHGFGGQ